MASEAIAGIQAISGIYQELHEFCEEILIFITDQLWASIE